MSISQNLRKFLVANGVDASTAQKVAFQIQHKAQQHTEVAIEEITLVHESIQRVPYSPIDRMKLERLLKKRASSTDKSASLSGMKSDRVGVKWKGTDKDVFKIPSPPAPPALNKLPRAYVKSWSTGGAHHKPLSPAMIRQLAYHIAAS